MKRTGAGPAHGTPGDARRAESRLRHSAEQNPEHHRGTGWGQDEDRRPSEEAGFDAHFVKPVDDAVLGRLLAEFSAGKQETRG